jgi:hypothetical protein
MILSAQLEEGEPGRVPFGFPRRGRQSGFDARRDVGIRWELLVGIEPRECRSKDFVAGVNEVAARDARIRVLVDHFVRVVQATLVEVQLIVARVGAEWNCREAAGD